jgi:hypothetical protein
MVLVLNTNIREKKRSMKSRVLKKIYFLFSAENKKGEGRFSFTFLRREISPATLWAALTAVVITYKVPKTVLIKKNRAPFYAHSWHLNVQQFLFSQ